jgi:hypothetical protein
VSLTRRVLLGFEKVLGTRGKSPSKGAKSDEYYKIQGDASLVIYDGRRGRNPTIAPPIQIYHPIFDEFTGLVNNPDVQPTVEDLDNVYELMHTLSCINRQEDDIRRKAHENIGHILGTPILEVQNPDNTRPDGVIMVELGKTSIPYVFLELKREIGEGGCDPTSQASLSMKCSWVHKEVGYNRIYFDPAFDF